MLITATNRFQAEIHDAVEAYPLWSNLRWASARERGMTMKVMGRLSKIEDNIYDGLYTFEGNTIYTIMERVRGRHPIKRI